MSARLFLSKPDPRQNSNRKATGQPDEYLLEECLPENDMDKNDSNKETACNIECCDPHFQR